MKSIEQLRNQLRLRPGEICSRISYFKKQKLDWEVNLPSINRNLQREFVWSLQQKREIVMSILFGRHIPHMAIINLFDDTWQVIDGKQRLSSIFNFIDGQFTIILEGLDYYFVDLPEDYQRAITQTSIRYYIVNEEMPGSITDNDKITWFKFINFAGTPQDQQHMDSLK